SLLTTGHVQAPFFDGHLVVWPASTRPGTLTSLHAYSVSAGRPARLPAALRAVRGTDFVVTDGTRTAYLDAGLKKLYYSPAPGRADGGHGKARRGQARSLGTGRTVPPCARPQRAPRAGRPRRPTARRPCRRPRRSARRYGR